MAKQKMRETVLEQSKQENRNEELPPYWRLF